MKKRLLLFLLLIVGASVAVVTYHQYSMRALATELQEQTRVVAQAYQTVVKENVSPLKKTYELTRSQENIVTRIEALAAELQEETSAADTVHAISALQIALVNFIQSVPAEQPMAEDPLFMHLRHVMSERSPLSPLLTAYNSLAIRWNTNLQSNMGSLAGSISSDHRSLLPFLRFDGQQEFIPVVQL